LAYGFAAALSEELDLLIEARNMTAVAAAARTKTSGCRRRPASVARAVLAAVSARVIN
jgi:hypothetical protein